MCGGADGRQNERPDSANNVENMKTFSHCFDAIVKLLCQPIKYYAVRCSCVRVSVTFYGMAPLEVD